MNSRFTYRHAFAILAISAFVAPPALAAPSFVIDTLSGWNGVDNIIYFGEFATATYGQTVSVGADNVLNGFTFLMRQDSPAPVRFRAYVMDWNETQLHATGPILYSSGNMQTSGQAGFETFSINTGNLQLTSGNDYVLFFSVLNNFDGVADAAAWASRAANVYAGGRFVYQHVDSFGAITTQPWTVDHEGPGYDLAFRAEFSRVPEPTSVLLATLGGLGFAVAARRRRPV
jgi:hypothetical protein